MSEHTPGPWYLEWEEDYAEFSDQWSKYPIGINAKGGQTLVLLSDDFYEGQIADAHLIAAAPELLEACRLIIRAYENADAAPEALDRAYAAIAKAEGAES